MRFRDIFKSDPYPSLKGLTPIGTRLGAVIAPVPIVSVDGADAVDTRAQIVKQHGIVHPVMMGTPDEIDSLFDGYANPKKRARQTLKDAKAIDVQRFFKTRLAEFQEDNERLDESFFDWPEIFESRTGLTSHCDYTGKPHKKILIGLLPTAQSWQAAAHLQFGGFNNCPQPEEHVAVHQYWEQRYGAQVVAMTGDSVEFELRNPVTEKSILDQLALEQLVYCDDIVFQGTETVGGLAASLHGAKHWFFWWD